jgi:hypothetical protein
MASLSPRQSISSQGGGGGGMGQSMAERSMTATSSMMHQHPASPARSMMNMSFNPNALMMGGGGGGGGGSSSMVGATMFDVGRCPPRAYTFTF